MWRAIRCWRGLASIPGISCAFADSKVQRLICLERINSQPHHPVRQMSWDNFLLVFQIRPLVQALPNLVLVMKIAKFYTTASLDSYNHNAVLTVQQQNLGAFFSWSKISSPFSSFTGKIKSQWLLSVVVLLQESLFGLFFLQSFNEFPLFMSPDREVISEGKKMGRWAIFQCTMERLMLSLSQALSCLNVHV